jgi:hypothetical protein
MKMATERVMGFVLKSVNIAERLTGNACKTSPFFHSGFSNGFLFLRVSKREYIGLNALSNIIANRIVEGEIWTLALQTR